MGKVLCFISEDFADFEVTLLFHKVRTVGKKEIITVGYNKAPVISESGLTYLADITVEEALDLGLDLVEGLIIPGGPIREQKASLTQLIQKMDKEKKLIAAICNGPQYLGRSGIIDDRKFTTSCSAERIKKMGLEDPFPRENFVDQRVVKDGHVVTSQGRAFVDFAFEIFDYLDVYNGKRDQEKQLYEDIMDRMEARS